MAYEDQNKTTRWNAEQVRRATGDSTPRTAASRRRRQKETRKKRIIKWFAFVMVTSLILAEVGWLLVNDMCSFNKDDVTVQVEITKDDSIGSIAKKLKQEGLINYKWFFKLFALTRNAKKKIGVGTYELSSDMDYNALINNMRNRDAALDANTVKVVIPEGYTVKQTIALLAKYGVSSEEKLTDAAENYDFDYAFLKGKKTGDVSRLEGYLFPDTYEFYVNEKPESALGRLLANFEAKTDELQEDLAGSGYSLDQILTIASLIEKETDGKDRAKIASVIYNRLNKTGETARFLQIDASLIYGLGDDYDGTLTTADKEKKTPYNLYINQGLPPTPIANPGLEAIRAALSPEHTDYFFYALGKDGVHHFFKTYQEHLNFINSKQYGG